MEDDDRDGNGEEGFGREKTPLFERGRVSHEPMLVERAGEQVIYEEYGDVAMVSIIGQIGCRSLFIPKVCVVIYDTFERELCWMQQRLVLTFDVGGEWELALLNSRRAKMVVAWGNAPGGWSKHYAQDIPACQVTDLPGLTEKISEWVLRYSKQHLQVS